MRPYTVRYSNPTALAAAGYAKVAALPFILDSRPGYHRLGSQYLIDRGVGAWSPRLKLRKQSAFAPTDATLKSYAHWLANFLEWAERRGVHLETCNYADHILGRYQPELLNGIWSRDARGLKPATVNAYVQQACDFLEWMAFKGKRHPFHVPTSTTSIRTESATDSRSHRNIEVETRQGKVRQNKRRLRMPSDDEVRTWVSSVHAKRGQALGLMMETVLLSAMRRSEVLAFRLDTLPLDERDWHISNPTALEEDQQVLVNITYGTKGPTYGKDHGDKIGPDRDINIPLHLARKIHRYREVLRARSLGIWVRQARGAAAQEKRRQDSVHLFLDEKTGHRIQSWQFYEAWKSGTKPFANWSPHLGRDWWACSTLWREMKMHEHVLQFGPKVPGPLLAAIGTNIIRLTIKRQLGHKRESTCFIYLQWVADMMGVALPEQYQQYLDLSDKDAEDDDADARLRT
jgi:integrase